MIRRASVEDLDELLPLFEDYRQFYRKEAAPLVARQFLRERMERDESAVFMAFEDEKAVGFAQLYPLFSSAMMARTFLLNDLFVSPDARRGGTGSALLQASVEYGRRQGAFRLDLSTELTNFAAQAVYEKNGWARDNVFCVYRFVL